MKINEDEINQILHKIPEMLIRKYYTVNSDMEAFITKPNYSLTQSRDFLSNDVKTPNLVH